MKALVWYWIGNCKRREQYSFRDLLVHWHDIVQGFTGSLARHCCWHLTSFSFRLWILAMVSLPRAN
ncbi:hypothetical protein FRX31_014087 [Thalictrum thalictroides]|uniref:Uncharacterized protein n=1 Tax=Thalictrum thalictroides TaxID=46969 RepID=A0A7J6WFV8_THATH|nr:hypothetical protein FRX31_014087 [Thalictrum thalictroides]